MFLTIAGSGINDYDLETISNQLDWNNFDCIITSEKFNSEKNKGIIPNKITSYFIKYKETLETIKQNLLNQRRVLYVVNGSPTFFSSMEIVIEHLKQNIPAFSEKNVSIINALSSKDYLLSKLKILDKEVSNISLHGKISSKLDLTKLLSSKYTFVLCDEFTIDTLNTNTKYVQDAIQVTIASKLGTYNENIETINLSIFSEKYNNNEIKENFMPYSLLIRRDYNLPSLISDNTEFKTRSGMLTKSHKRFFTLEALKLFPNCLLWDIGAGSGSVSIDAYKIFKAKTVLFEKNPIQCSMISENLREHKVIGCLLVENDFLNVLPTLSTADRIFIGGGGKLMLSNLQFIIDKLNAGGILVANIIGLENLSLAVQEIIKTKYDYEIRNISVNIYNKMNNYPELSISLPERPLFQVIIRK